MQIKRTSDGLISGVDTKIIHSPLDYLTYKEATLNSKAKQADVDTLAKVIKRGWWAKKKSKLVK